MASKKSYTLLAIVGVIVLLGVMGMNSYNRLVSADENLDTAWRQVETQYQRRVDLIPNLVETVRGVSNFEQETLTAVTEARTQWQNAGTREEQVAAANQTESAIGRLLVTVESYPTLTASSSYENLMVQLEGTENRIAVARMDYNNEVRDYNLIVRRFPGNIMAAIFGYSAEEGFESEAGADVAPDVQFTD